MEQDGGKKQGLRPQVLRSEDSEGLTISLYITGTLSKVVASASICVWKIHVIYRAWSRQGKFAVFYPISLFFTGCATSFSLYGMPKFFR
jgi:hypothetical protein